MLAQPQLVVLGGTVLDVQAFPAPGSAHDVRRGSSVPGRVTQLPGGVGRNIAEAAHHLLQQQQEQQQQGHTTSSTTTASSSSLGAPCSSSGVLLLSVVGCDTAAAALLASFEEAGMSTAGLVRSSAAATPCVVAVLDRGGEVAASVADVAAPTLELTPAFVQRHACDIAAARLLVLDANLAQASLAAAVQAAAGGSVPVVFEPVSVPKAARCTSILSSLFAITPNAAELWAIADAVQQQAQLPRLPRPAAAAHANHHHQQQQQQQDSSGTAAAGAQQAVAQLAPAAAVVLQQGLHCIILTLGEHGAAILTLQQQQPWQQQQHRQHHTAAATVTLRAQHVPAVQGARVTNLSGAGDTLVGGFAAAWLRGSSSSSHDSSSRRLVGALAVGVAAAALSVGCPRNVPGPSDGLVFQSVHAAAQQLLRGQAEWEFAVPTAPRL